MRNNKKKAVFFIFPIIIAIVSLISLLCFQWANNERVKQNVYNNLQESVNSQSAAINSRLNGQFETLTVLSKTVASLNMPLEQVIPFMNRVKDSTEYSCIGIADRNGIVQTDTGEEIDISNDDYYLKALKGQNIIAKTDTGRTKAHFTLAVPIRDGHTINGVLICNYYERELRKLLTSRVLGKNGYSFLVDDDGQVVIGNVSKAIGIAEDENIYAAINRGTMLCENSATKIQEDLKNQQNGIFSYRSGSTVLYAIYRPVGVSDWNIFTICTEDFVIDQVQQTNKNARVLTLIVMICSVLLFIFVVWRESMNNRLLQDEFDNLQVKADKDALTGIYNRGATEKRIISYLEGIGKYSKHALLMIDLDNFKNINDNLGHIAGDHTLSKVGESIKLNSGNNSIVGRIGGDEFVVFVKNIKDESEAEEVAKTLCQKLQFSQTRYGDVYTVTCSIGICVYNNDGRSFTDLYDDADEALYEAKSQGKNRYAFAKKKLVKEKEEISSPNGATIQLQALLTHMIDGVLLVEVGENIKVLYASPGFYKMTNVDLQTQASEFNIKSMVYEDDQEIVQSYIRACAQSDKLNEFKYRAIDKAGNIAYRYARSVKIPYDNSEYPVIMSVIMDSTKQTLSEKEEKLAFDYTKIAIDLSNTSFFEIDIEKRTLKCSSEQMKSYKTTQPYIENMPDGMIETGIIHPDSVEDYKAYYNNVFSGEAENSCIIRAKINDGEYTLIKITSKTIFDNSNKPIKAIGIIENIENILDTRFKFEQELKLKLLVTNDVIGVAQINLSKNKIDYLRVDNEKMMSVKSFTELYNLNLEMFANLDERIAIGKKYSVKNLDKAFHNGKQWMFNEYKVVLSNGNIIWISNTVRLLLNPDNGDLCGFFYLRNVDQKKKCELAINEKPNRVGINGVYDNCTTKNMINYIMQTDIDTNKYSVLIILYITNYQQIKKLFGTIMTDKITESFSRHLRICMDSSIIIGELAEDKFAIYISDIKDYNSIEEKIASILRTIKSPGFYTAQEEQYAIFNLGASVSKNSNAVYDVMLSEATAAANWAISQNQPFIIYNDKMKIKLKLPTESENFSPSENGEDNLDVDSLTGVWSRNSMFDYMHNANYDVFSSFGVLILKIVNLRTLNEKYGNQFGDLIIKFAAESLKNTFDGNKIYRYSAGEFIAFSQDIKGSQFEEKIGLVKNIIKSKYNNTVAFGYTWSDSSIDIMKLIKSARDQMYIDKQRLLAITTDFTTASNLKTVLDYIKDGNYKMYLQPKINLSTNKICGAEALVRLKHNENKDISPLKFVELLEQEGFIRYVDVFILEEACKSIKEWQKKSVEMPVSVNFSRKTLFEEKILDRVIEIVDKYEVRHNLIEIEITERVGSLDMNKLKTIVEEFRNNGFLIAIDDFGSEYSGIAVLSKIKFDILKLDISMIKNLVSNRVIAEVVRDAIRICHDLNIVSIAEGVETKEQMEILREFGCDCIQGYLINKPLKPENFEKLYISE